MYCSVRLRVVFCCSELAIAVEEHSPQHSNASYVLENLCVAVCCSVLQCVAVCCSVLQCVAVCCSVLQCVVVCYSVLQCVVLCCSVRKRVVICCSELTIVSERHSLE